MRKRILAMALLMLFLLTACGGSKWSCNKRYCDTTKASSTETLVNP